MRDTSRGRESSAPEPALHHSSLITHHLSGRVLALDPGERRVGVALSDDLGVLATPLTVLERRSWAIDVAAIAELVTSHEATEVVVGHPKTLRGEIGPQARRAERFAREVARAVEVPVRLWDERFSTVEAADRLGGGTRRSGRRRDSGPGVDAAAAAVILQDYLDSRR